jgi:hypothetical protein
MRILNNLFTKNSRPTELSYLETLAAQARKSRSRGTKRAHQAC